MFKPMKNAPKINYCGAFSIYCIFLQGSYKSLFFGADVIQQVEILLFAFYIHVFNQDHANKLLHHQQNSPYDT